MTAFCRDCGSTDIQSDQPADDGWYSILVTLSDQVPSEDHCQAWLESRGISDATVEQVATSMLASLRYDIKKRVWHRGKTEYVDVWAMFRSWCLRDLRQNSANGTGGVRSGTGMRVKKDY